MAYTDEGHITLFALVAASSGWNLDRALEGKQEKMLHHRI